MATDLDKQRVANSQRRNLLLDGEQRANLWKKVIEAIEAYLGEVHTRPVRSELHPEKIRSWFDQIDFARPLDPLAAVDLTVSACWQYQTHTAHPRYFGLFDPAPATMAIAAEMLVATFNPQLAVWSH